METWHSASETGRWRIGDVLSSIEITPTTQARRMATCYGFLSGYIGNTTTE